MTNYTPTEEEVFAATNAFFDEYEKKDDDYGVLYSPFSAIEAALIAAAEVREKIVSHHPELDGIAGKYDSDTNSFICRKEND